MRPGCMRATASRGGGTALSATARRSIRRSFSSYASMSSAAVTVRRGRCLRCIRAKSGIGCAFPSSPSRIWSKPSASSSTAWESTNFTPSSADRWGVCRRFDSPWSFRDSRNIRSSWPPPTRPVHGSSPSTRWSRRRSSRIRNSKTAITIPKISPKRVSLDWPSGGWQGISAI